MKLKNIIQGLLYLLLASEFQLCKAKSGKHATAVVDNPTTLVVKETSLKKTNENVGFNSLQQLYQDTSSVKWTDAGSFWWLYFEPGKVSFDFNPSCGYWFTTKLEKGKIVFYWAQNMNCNIHRGLDATFKNIQSPKIGKAFGEIYLINDTTIQIVYNYKDWVRKVNEKEHATIDTLFPNLFKIVRL